MLPLDPRRAGHKLDPMDPNAETAGGGGPSGPMPDRVGTYRVLAEIGRGGFGVVYEAEQTQPVRRRVALKVIKPGMDSGAVVARFEGERQALAVMDHPCIAKVFDGGVTRPEHGSRPYFVMELVRGSPITEFCDTNRLTIGERAELFVRVCAAVQHAHSKGVIHRDLKPSNVLVGYDGDGIAQPKIIDFGVAKALNQRLSEHTIFTERGQLIGTPEYMSPEQAEMSDIDIDTRSDVYALGVMLYELLTGSLPFTSETLREAGYAEIQRIIREVDPPRPSTRLVTSVASEADGTRAARARSTDVRSLAGVLRRDLDWVVMKCLEKDRERRYATASALTAELRRFLAGEPVEAGPPGAGYRLSKFVRRNRGPVTAGVVVAAALVVSVAISAWFGVSERGQRAIADRATRAATVERTRAQASLSFLTDVLTSIDPNLAGGMDTALLRSVLGDAARRLEGSPGMDPEVEATLRRTIADAYSSVGAFEDAGRHYDAAHALMRGVWGAEHPETIEARRLGANARMQSGDLARARTDLEAVLGSVDRLPAEYAPLALRARIDLATLLESEGRLEEAEREYRALLEGASRTFGPAAPETLTLRNNLGHLLSLTERPEEGAEQLRLAMVGFRATSGDASTATLRATLNYAGVLMSHGRADLAAEPMIGVLEACERRLPPDHPLLLHALNNVALLRIELGEHEAAERDLACALTGLERTLGLDHPMTLTTRHNLGYLLQIQGRAAEAERHVVGAAAGRIRALGPTDDDTLISVNNAGALLVELGVGVRALEMYRTVAAATLGSFGPSDERTLASQHNLGWLLRKIGRPGDAVAVLRPTLERREARLGPDDPATMYTQYNLAAALIDLGDREEALAVSRSCVERNTRVYGEEHDETAYARELIGRAAALAGG